MKLPHGFKTFVLSIFEWPICFMHHAYWKTLAITWYLKCSTPLNILVSGVCLTNFWRHLIWLHIRLQNMCISLILMRMHYTDSKFQCVQQRSPKSSKNFECKVWNIFIFISFSIWLGCSKELSDWKGSFEYPQHMFWLRNKNFWICIRICGAQWLNWWSADSDRRVDSSGLTADRVTVFEQDTVCCLVYWFN